MTAVQRVRCDGCGKEAEIARRARCGPPRWRRLHVYWRVDGAEELVSRIFDVCPDPMCAARVVDVTRDADRPVPHLELMRGRSS